MEYRVFGKVVKVTSELDICGFWNTYVLVEVDGERFGAGSGEVLGKRDEPSSDIRDQSIRLALSKLEETIRKNAAGDMVHALQDWLSRELHRQELTKALIANVLPECP